MGSDGLLLCGVKKKKAGGVSWDPPLQASPIPSSACCSYLLLYKESMDSLIFWGGRENLRTRGPV